MKAAVYALCTEERSYVDSQILVIKRLKSLIKMNLLHIL